MLIKRVIGVVLHLQVISLVCFYVHSNLTTVYIGGHLGSKT